MHGLGTIIALNNKRQSEHDRKVRAAARIQARLRRLEAQNRVLRKQLSNKAGK